MAKPLITRIKLVLWFSFFLSHFSIAEPAAFDPGTDIPFDFDNPRSAWYEYNQAVYSQLLKLNFNSDFLVIPFQVRDHGIDLVGRSLMSRYIEDGIANQFNKKIPAIDLVEKALGEHRRRYPIDQVFELANTVKTKKVVVGYAGHDNNGNMSIAIRVYSPSKTSKKYDDRKNFIQQEWTNLKIDDEHLPSFVFYSKLDQMIKFITGKKSNIASKKRPIEKLPKKLPAKFNQVVLNKNNNSPLKHAYFLQLVGMLHPGENLRQRERVFEKSMIALSKTSPKSQNYYILKARALHYLHRRPAAQTELKKSKAAPEKSALHAQLNGNLPQKIKHTSTIKNPLMKLIDVIETETLFHKYNNLLSRNLSNKLKFSSEDWKYLISRRISGMDPWNVESNIRIKAIMDEVFPISGSTAKSNLNASILQGKNNAIDLELSVVEHIKNLLSEKPHKWCCNSTSWRVSSWEYLNLLEGIAESNLLKKLDKLISYQNSPDAGYDLFEKLERVYKGHPQFADLGIKVISKIFKNANSSQKDILGNKGNDLAIGMYAWSNGQRDYIHDKTEFVFNHFRSGLKADAQTDGIQEETANYDYARNALYVSDFPTRPYWRPLPVDPPSKKLNFYVKATKYTSSDFEPILHYKKELPANERNVLSKQLKNRFLGHPRRLEVLADIKIAAGDEKGEIELYQDAITDKSYSWKPYWRLGKKYVEQGKYKDAGKIFDSFPLFKDPESTTSVRTSNQAHSAASLLYVRGELEIARPLLEIASNTNTGSRSDFGSKIKLSFMKKDYATAAKYLYARARRYNNDYDFGMLMALLHAMGDSKTAWQIFDSLVGKVKGPYLWLGPLIGHRIQSTSDEELYKWSENPRYANHTSRRGKRFVDFKARFLSQVMSIDRKARAAGLKNMYAKKSMIKALKKTSPVNLYIALKSMDKDLLGKMLEKSKLSLMQINDWDGMWYPYQVLAHLFYFDAETSSQLQKVKDTNSWATLNLEKIEKTSEKVDYEGRFNLYLSTAILKAKENKHQEAISFFKKAFRYQPDYYDRNFDPVYQLVEISEWLYKLTNKQEYIQQALKWVNIYQVIYPVYSWPYTFEAKYASNENDKLEALAIGQYLDPKSNWISEIPDSQKQKAKEWFKKHNPFNIEETKQQKGA